MTRLVLLVAMQMSLLGWIVPRSRDVLARTMDVAAAGWQSAPPGELLEGLVHAVAVVAISWLLVATIVEVGGAFRGHPGRRVTPRWVRRIVDQAVGTALLVGILSGQAMAQSPVPTTGITADLREAPPAQPPVGPPPPLPTPESTSTPAAPPTAPSPEAGAAGPMDASDGPSGGPGVGGDGSHHTVAAGENLWVIARARLLQLGPDPQGSTAPDDRTVHAYWVRLLAANSDRLASGDPDLIYPGERLVLPPIDQAASSS